jgi:protein-tyrosine phosphatase
MIDLHSHILPGIDDGAKSMEQALEMARQAVDDGVSVMACTPHMQPGVYDTTARDVRSGIAALARALEAENIPLTLVEGADVHVVPDLVEKLDDGRILPLNGSRYFLFEPPHHVVPPGLDRLAAAALKAGHVPVLTHPERLTWIEAGYDLVTRLDEMGCAVQITAAAVTGGFGPRPKYWSERLLDEGRVDIIASDAHDPRRRPAGLSQARAAIAGRLGEAAAQAMVYDNPLAMLEDRDLPGKTRRKVPVARPARSSGGLMGLFRRK